MNDLDTSTQDLNPPQDNPPQASAGDNDWEAKYRELNDQFLRLAADFDNFRKRSYQEHESARKMGREMTLQELLPVMDNLERATGSLTENSDPKMLYQSFRLMYKQLMDTFANLGLKKMQVVGEPFDPKFHEAVTQIETDDHPDQTVVTEMQSGYMLYDHVLRPAMVSVSSRITQEAASANPFAQASRRESGFSPNADTPETEQQA